MKYFAIVALMLLVTLVNSSTAMSDNCLQNFTEELPEIWNPFRISDIADPDLRSWLKTISPNAKKAWIHTSLRGLLAVGSTPLHRPTILGLTSDAFRREIEELFAATKLTYLKNAEVSGSVNELKEGFFRVSIIARYTDQSSGIPQVDFRYLYFFTPTCRLDVLYNEGFSSESPVHSELIQKTLGNFEKSIVDNPDLGIEFPTFQWRRLVFIILFILIAFFVRRLPIGPQPAPKFLIRKAILIIFYLLGTGVAAWLANICESDGLCRDALAQDYSVTFGLLAATLLLITTAFLNRPRIQLIFWAYNCLFFSLGLNGLLLLERPNFIGIAAMALMIIMCLSSIRSVYRCISKNAANQANKQE